MSLKMPKQVLKSKGFLVDIFSTWESLGISGFGSAKVPKVSCCDGRNSCYFKKFQHVGTYHPPTAVWDEKRRHPGMYKSRGLFRQGCCQDAFYLQMWDGKNVHNTPVVQQVGGFTVEHLTSIPHSHLVRGCPNRWTTLHTEAGPALQIGSKKLG